MNNIELGVHYIVSNLFTESDFRDKNTQCKCERESLIRIDCIRIYNIWLIRIQVNKITKLFSSKNTSDFQVWA